MEIWYPIPAISVQSFSAIFKQAFGKLIFGILNGSSVKMILAYNIMKILSPKMSPF